MNRRLILNIDKHGRAEFTKPGLSRITQAAARVAAAKADEVRAELAKLAESMRRSLGQQKRRMEESK